VQILLVFIKNPRLGYVKTRLAATVGDHEALRIYHLLLEKTRAAALGCAAERWLWYSDEITSNDEWGAADFHKKVQPEGDLGVRMEAAFAAAFAAGAEKVVIVGSDCPELDGTTLNAAFAALDHTDVVLGPTPDGGYYLLGMKRLYPELFHNVAWSTGAVFLQTLEKLYTRGLVHHSLPVLTDIDNEADWAGYLQRT
jgi:hypothetical protein